MELVCINCPRGCHLNVTKQNDEVIVTGNMCPRGKTYAINELTNPMRTITTTVSVIAKNETRLPVITSCQIPKDKMMDIVKALKEVSVKAPVKINDVIVKNICGLQADIISAKTIEE